MSKKPGILRDAEKVIKRQAGRLDKYERLRSLHHTTYERDRAIIGFLRGKLGDLAQAIVDGRAADQKIVEVAQAVVDAAAMAKEDATDGRQRPTIYAPDGSRVRARAGKAVLDEEQRGDDQAAVPANPGTQGQASGRDGVPLEG